MDYKKIESFKLAILSLAKRGCRIRISSYGIEGRIVGVGFKPYWTVPGDSVIEKLEITYIDQKGRLVPFSFNKIVGYEVISNDGRGYDSMKNACMDIHIFSGKKNRKEEPLEKVRIEISSEEDKST
ncbi:MAG: hypothetical protein N2484_00525 [Clostridia bacterium]|nr:hypothetical protein [Clostridia bacterium]